MTVIPAARVFDFHTDTFAYPNELVWEYHTNSQSGKTFTKKRSPPPSYAHHCFVVVRSARQFFLHAAFDPHTTPLSDNEYLARIREVVRRCPRAAQQSSARISVPGFANLREFSEVKPELLKAACGGAWQSYVQRGNWRMVLPFSRAGQRRTAQQLSRKIATGGAPILHVATFPSLTINHALLLFASSVSGSKIEFQAYDPNICAQPLALCFDRESEWFQFPPTPYFPGGNVNGYEIYCGAIF